MATRIYSVILCEGYYDRAFWDGYLENSGWIGGASNIPKDPHGSTHKGQGKHAHAHTDGNFVLLVPCEGESKLREAFQAWLPSLKAYSERTDACDRYQIIVNRDDDSLEGGENPTRGADTVRQLLQEAGTLPPKIEVKSVVWKAYSSSTLGIPEKQTLERLVCVAIVSAYPERAQVVEDYLHKKDPKSYAWAYMSKWYGENGCDDFYQGLWRDEKLRMELERLLKEIGAWTVFESFQG